MALPLTSPMPRRILRAALLALGPLLLAGPVPAQTLPATPPEDAAAVLAPGLGCSATELLGTSLRQQIRAETRKAPARRSRQGHESQRRQGQARPAPPAPPPELAEEEPAPMFLRAFHVCMTAPEEPAQPVRYRT